jgi:hypothetical protein
MIAFSSNFEMKKIIQKHKNAMEKWKTKKIWHFNMKNTVEIPNRNNPP